ncbi:MAG: ABC transporter permease [Elusimicrobia bacterium]|nr:ABC transporter permease [Elusimicrobiota bacterium]
MKAAFFLAAGALWRRELLRFYRDKSRVIGALVPPFLFWFLIGSGLNKSFRLPGAADSVDYLEYFFPGTVVLILLFTAIFSTISIIEDRREGFLQSVLIAPVPRSAIALGKILGSTTLALLQALPFLLLAPVMGFNLSAEAFWWGLTALILVALGLSSLGFCLAWMMESTQGFHAIMNLFLIPLWLLSGALFPASGASPWVALVMKLNPVTYGVAALQQTLLDPSTLGSLPSLGTCLASISLFNLAVFIAAVRIAQK